MNQELLNRLVSEDWRERHDALEQIGQTGDQELAGAVLEIVRSSHADLSTLSGTLQALELIGRSLTGEMVALLKSPDRELRVYVPLVLGALGDPSAAPALAETAGDTSESENARFNAIEALGRLEPARAGEQVRQQAAAALRQVLRESTPFLRYAAVVALGQCADPTLIPDLLPLLEDDYLSEPTITALGQLASLPGADSEHQAQVTGALARWLGSDAAGLAGCEAAVTAIGEVAQAAGSSAADLEAVRRAFITGVGANYAGAVSRLEALDGDPDPDLCAKEALTASLAQQLGWLEAAGRPDAGQAHDPIVRAALGRLVRCPAARPLVEAALSETPLPIPNEVIELLHSEDPEDSLSAARFLVNLAKRSGGAGAAGQQAERAVLAQAFAGAMESGDEMLVSLCAEGLGSLGPGVVDEAAVARLSGLLALSSPRIRKAVISALAQLQPPGLEQRIEAWLEDPNPNLRESALRLVAALPAQPEGASPPGERFSVSSENTFSVSDRNMFSVSNGNMFSVSAFSALMDPSPEVRRAAVELLPRFNDPQAISALSQALDDPDDRMRISAVRACAELPPADALPLLNRAIQDSDHWVRMHAVRALAGIARPESLPTIAFYLRDPFSPVRIAAIEGLARFNDPNALDHYLRPLLEDEDAEVRRAAQAALQPAALQGGKPQ